MIGNSARRTRLVASAMCGVVGLVAVVMAAVGTSGTRDVTDQLSYIATGGIVGLFFLAAAGTLLVVDFMFEQEAQAAQLSSELVTIRQFLRGDELTLVDPPSVRWQPPAAVAGPATSDHLVAINGARRFHRSDCALVAEKPAARPVSAEDLRSTGLEACRVCEPQLPALSSK